MKSPPPGDAAPRRALSARTWLRLAFMNLAYLASVLAVLLAGSGSLFWIQAWIFTISVAIASILKGIIFIPRDPEQVEERAHIRQGAKPWDLHLLGALAVLTYANLLVAALDRTFGWSPSLPAWLWIAAYLPIVGGTIGGFAAQYVNPFFSSVVRIQLWAFVPTAISLALMVVRTAREDATLLAELPGYVAYAERTKYRLIPGVWWRGLPPPSDLVGGLPA